MNSGGREMVGFRNLTGSAGKSSQRNIAGWLSLFWLSNHRLKLRERRFNPGIVPIAVTLLASLQQQCLGTIAECAKSKSTNRCGDKRAGYANMAL
jgi:hypothetical protein